ncbi:DUF4349 domain-containing protein [Chitinophaga qingshengii]|uniref:DUF4349 domain-containing protein n=1 Tax=Chitinophaga qingshengii TaxID=1569794 RepID=A0ABR7TTK6_9BACT|nr:DUF4349 domain-containing protein [Chitinophaga qingshengii]MBC9933375.1 DUF4349 domain-containing protein [Chitinophaga qingshengii]
MKYLTLVSAFCILVACSHPNTPAASIAPAPAAVENETAPAGLMAPVEDAVVSDAKMVTEQPAADVPDQKIIRTARIVYSVEDFSVAKKRIAGIVSKSGGFILAETQHGDGTQIRNQLDIKVPAKAFDSCVESLTSGVSRLDEKSINSQDVTTEYVDLDARMKTRVATEQRYLEILKQAHNVKEVLEVEAQLKSIREEIEAAKGRLQYMDRQASYSTIHLEYYQVLALSSPEAPGFFPRAWLALHEGWNNVLGLLIDGMSWWPLILVAVFLFIFIRRRRRKNKALAA